MSMATAQVSTPATKQPRGLYLLFNVEMWERFSFYGMRAILVLFLASTQGGFGWSRGEANQLLHLYNGLVYLTPLLGGYLADRFLGTHRAILVGSVLIASGHFSMAIPSKTAFFTGLALIILGTGFHKSNISTMVGQLYGPGDTRRDAAFTIFYMGINIGAFLGPLVCSSLAESNRFGWHWGFAAAGVGMVLGTLLYVWKKKSFLGSIGDVPAARVVVGNKTAGQTPLTREEKERIAAIIIIAFFNIFFWSAFEQAASSLNFFAAERTQRVIGGVEIPAGFFQSINAFAIIVSAPLFAMMWVRLGARNREPSTPIKFVFGLLLVSAGFVVMVFAARFSEGGKLVSPLWLTVAYLLHTWGELCLSPVGLSMVTKLAPAKLGALMMGCWFCSWFLAELLGGLIAGSIEKIERGEVFHLLGGQADFFLIFVILPGAAALLLFAISGKLKKLMHGLA
jgi:proton-dependent oligopeptide transporter, POT family